MSDDLEPKRAPEPTLFQSLLLAALHRRLEAVAQRVQPDAARSQAAKQGAEHQLSAAS